ncbi:DEAD/DEAH box helicase family protein [Microbacterium marinilacus]|uniref:DEAD/DEAH box helicase family protein n=1 Tax=Microbacterium marinilacus TaxID=415209 RepID=A0ABP7BUF6_9MICO|nr:DEAD/DEAH box helicase family protein [Microbacterium marinilacus]MBY0688160.1 DEAD/DEAH box helicase family protein [Microbacterium marinilacus]
MQPPPTRPLSRWRFEGELRHYQADVLDRVDVDGDEPLHIVAPPGSGKTLLGLLLAARRGSRTLVLAPTVTIRDQWTAAARGLAPDERHVSRDPQQPGELTALTYQALSVLDARNPLAQLAEERWRNELEAEGHAPDAAAAWLDRLRSGNARAHASGIARRSRTLRRRMAREDPETLARALHPNARVLIDRLVAHGVETIVLDECHHLLDHWALVVAALLARLRARGRHPLVIGLTATLPSPDDGDAYDNYTALLGDVDYEVPVPAVVREGNLAPYRELVRFVEPTTDELAFLRGQATGLSVLIHRTFAQGRGADFVVRALQPDAADADERSPLVPPRAVDPVSDMDARLSKAFADDFAGAEAAAAMLATVAPDHPVVARLPAPSRRPPTTDEALRLLGRYALHDVLPDPAAADRWERIRRSLADFGYSLTDRGLRRTRDPIDTMLASSLAKDYAVCDILRSERAELGDRLRALVVTDFTEHGNRHGGLINGAGALRAFSVLAADVATADLRVALVTGAGTRIAARDAQASLPHWRAALGVAVAAEPTPEDPAVLEIRAPGTGTSAHVRAAAELLTRGHIDVVVGTRGLFGEGWGCPAVNTLIDLTAVATPSATQQLRGRTLRLDPAWPEKTAHNWTITALLPPGFPLDAAPDLARLRRKHARLWGLQREDSDRVVRGLSATFTDEQRRLLTAPEATAERLNGLTATVPRATTRAQWRIGDDYLDTEEVSVLARRRAGEPVFRTSARSRLLSGARAAGAASVAIGGIALLATGAVVAAAAGAALVVAALVWGLPSARAWWRERRYQSRPDGLYRRIGGVIVAGLRRSGRVTGRDVGVAVSTTPGSSPGEERVTVTFPGAGLADQRVLAQAMTELFGPIGVPRYVLELGVDGRPRIERRAGSAAFGRARSRQYLAVPTAIGRRGDDVRAFADDWRREVGPCRLHALDRTGSVAVLAQARRDGGTAETLDAHDDWR